MQVKQLLQRVCSVGPFPLLLNAFLSRDADSTLLFFGGRRQIGAGPCCPHRRPPCWRGFLALCVLTALLFHSCAASQLSCLHCVKFPSLPYPKFGIPVGIELAPTTINHQLIGWSPAVCVLSSSLGDSPLKYQSSRLCFLPECSVDACSAYHLGNGFSLFLLPPSVAYSICV